MGGKQLGFSDYELTTAKKQTKREKFLSEMDVVVPWQALIALIEPHYPKASKKGGRPPYPLATMLRVHLLQQWYYLSEASRIDVTTGGAHLAGLARLYRDHHPPPRLTHGFKHGLDLPQAGFEAWPRDQLEGERS